MPGRRATLVAGLAGQLSAAVVGALDWVLLPVATVLLVVLTEVAGRVPAARAGLVRHAGSGFALVAVALVLASSPPLGDATALKPTLGLLLVGAQLGQALHWQAARDLRAGLGCALGLLVLSASYAPDVLVGAPLLVGWAAAVVALARPHTHRVVATTAVAVVLGLVAFLLVPVPLSPGLRSRLAGASPPPLRTTAGLTAFTGDTLDLRQRGALPTQPVISVPADSPVLWRSAVFERYDGRRWTRRPGSALVATGPVVRGSRLLGPADRVDRVEARGRTDGTVWAPGRVHEVRDAGTRRGTESADGDLVLVGGPGSYTVASGVDRAEPDGRFSALPYGLPRRVIDLAAEVGGDPADRVATAERIAAHLRERATYRVDSPVPARGEDAVDRFLFVDRTGFCEQFASAEVLLLRALGIPARLVTGLAYGVPEGERRLFRVADAHAWAEYWVPGSGWVSVDPTAGAPLAAGSTGLGVRERLARAVTSGLRSLTHGPGGKAGLAALLLLVSAVAVATAGRRLPQRRTAGGAALPQGGPALQAFLRWDLRQGARRRRPAESLRELAARSDAEVARALAVVELECYAARAPDPSAAVDVLDRY